MSKKELKRLLKDKFPDKQPCSVKEFEKHVKEGAKAGLVDLEIIEQKCLCQV